jgi:hypothetical protein
MKNATNSMYAQVAYMLGMGIGLLFMPNFVLDLFGISAVTDNWVRVVGALALVLALEYYCMVKVENVDFYNASVWGRFLFCAILVLLVTMGYLDKPVYLFAVAEAGLALWTQMALKKG